MNVVITFSAENGASDALGKYMLLDSKMAFVIMSKFIKRSNTCRWTHLCKNLLKHPLTPYIGENMEITGTLTDSLDLWLLQKHLPEYDAGSCCPSIFYKTHEEKCNTSNLKPKLQFSASHTVWTETWDDIIMTNAAPSVFIHLLIVLWSQHWGGWVLFLDCRVSVWISSSLTFNIMEQGKKTTRRPIFV